MRWRLENDYQNQAKIFKAFADENRLKILSLLHDGEKCCCVLLENLAIGQSALSYHMRILLEAGIVEGRQEGKWTHYRICEQGSRKAIDLLSDLTKINPET